MVLGLRQLLKVDQLGGVIAAVAGVTVLAALAVGHRLAHAGQRQLAQRVRLQKAADFLDG